MNKAEKAANLLLQARLAQQPLPNLPADCFPANLLEAYAMQEALVEKLIRHYGGAPAGYKIGCTNRAAQQFLNLNSPFYGRLLSAAVFTTPAQFKAKDFVMRVIEPEFAFEIAQDLPAQSTPYTQDEVLAAIGAIIPAIEIVESRYQDWTTVGAASLIADQAVHAAWVRGRPVADWRHLDLAAHRIEFWLNGQLAQTGSGAVVLGHPVNVLTWLANALNEHGKGLQAGDFVTTGICVNDIYNAAAGDKIKADFGELGSVEVAFE